MTSDCTIVTSEQHLYQTIVQFGETIVLPRKLATGNIHDYIFCYCPLVDILFEVLRIQTKYINNKTNMVILTGAESFPCVDMQCLMGRWLYDQCPPILFPGQHPVLITKTIQSSGPLVDAYSPSFGI